MQTERERWIVQGLCLYCGGQGHKASECSKARKARETSGRAAEPMPPPTGPSTTPVEPTQCYRYLDLTLGTAPPPFLCN